MIRDTIDRAALREERLARNEAVFRTLNEKIASQEIDVELNARHDFVCECSTSGCFERVTLTRDQYEAVRVNGAHFLLVGGHEDIQIEQTVAVNEGYIVVEKDGAAGIIARGEDPRG